MTFEVKIFDDLNNYQSDCRSEFHSFINKISRGNIARDVDDPYWRARASFILPPNNPQKYSAFINQLQPYGEHLAINVPGHARDQDSFIGEVVQITGGAQFELHWYPNCRFGVNGGFPALLDLITRYYINHRVKLKTNGFAYSLRFNDEKRELVISEFIRHMQGLRSFYIPPKTAILSYLEEVLCNYADSLEDYSAMVGKRKWGGII